MWARRTTALLPPSRKTQEPLLPPSDSFVSFKPQWQPNSTDTSKSSTIDRPPQQRDSGAFLASSASTSTSSEADEEASLLADVERDAGLPPHAAKDAELRSENAIRFMERTMLVLGGLLVCALIVVFVIWTLTDPEQAKQLWEEFLGFWVLS